MKTILVVDDSASIREVACLTLSRGGYEVVEAVDGKDALRKLAANKCHLIISDMNMPNLDGIAFAREVKQDPHNKFTPIIMLTTDASDAKKALGKAAGVRAWMLKPFQPQTMLDAVTKLMPP